MNGPSTGQAPAKHLPQPLPSTTSWRLNLVERLRNFIDKNIAIYDNRSEYQEHLHLELWINQNTAKELEEKIWREGSGKGKNWADAVWGKYGLHAVDLLEQHTGINCKRG